MADKPKKTPPQEDQYDDGLRYNPDPLAMAGDEMRKWLDELSPPPAEK
jgi:hypothetical protein